MNKKIIQVLKNLSFSLIIILSAYTLCKIIRIFDEGDIYISMIFILAIFVISRYTSGYFYGIATSIIGVFAINYVFTYPYHELNLTMNGYPITIVSMLLVSTITSMMTTQMTEKEKIKAIAVKEQMKSNLLRAISHDLRTPLTSILGLASVINDNYDKLSNTEIKELSSEIISDSEWLIRMVENLLSVTRLGSEGYSIEKTDEIAEEIAMSAVSKIKNRYKDADISIILPDDILFVPMDSMLIQQVLINLIENSIRHGNADKITLTILLVGTNVSFTVKDNGTGIKSDKINHIFSDKFSLNTNQENDKTKNMGIGLSLCRTIIKAHGGKIYAKNALEGGAEFMFLLPLSDDNSDKNVLEVHT